MTTVIALWLRGVTVLASVCLHGHTFIQPGPMLTD